jgi:hypothetical protein
VPDDTKLDEEVSKGEPGAGTATETQPNSDDPLADKPELQSALLKLFLKFVADDRYARLVEVRECAHDHHYWRGNQYIWWSDRDKCFNAATGAQTYGAGIDIADMPHFEYVTNIYQAGGLTAIAAVAGAAPPIRWFPKDPNKPEDIETAEGYEKLAKLIERWNPPKLLLQDEVYYMWCDGVVGLYTEYIEDGEKFGYDTKEALQEGEAQTADQVKCDQCGYTAPSKHFVSPVPCPECGKMLTEENLMQGETTPVPEEAGEEHIPKGRQTINAYGALELRRPQWAKEQCDFHYLAYDHEVHYAVLKAKFPDKASQIQPGGGGGTDDTYERNARLSVSQGTNLLTQTGGALSVLCTWSKVWMRPTAFYAASETERDELLELFPRGCRVEFCGSTYLTSANESMDDCWVVYHSMPGDGQHRPGLGSSQVSVQDQYNTGTNIRAETYEYGIPTTILDADAWDQGASSEQKSEPGDRIFLKCRPVNESGTSSA